MNLAAVVVWFNPDKSFINNILTYINDIEICYIVDNSNNDNSELIANINKIIYIPNKQNLGIATALNIGCQKALEDGFDWCLTLDQDSYFDHDQLKKYKQKVQQFNKNENASFTLNFKYPINQTSYLGDIKRKLFPQKTINQNISEIETPIRCMTSGNIISLQIWNSIGKFDDSLFIDEVDHEFCYRLANNGYKIICFNDVYINHCLGNVSKKTIFPIRKKHIGIRLYYIVRNKMYIMEKYPTYSNLFKYKKDLQEIFLENLFYLKFKNILWMIRGYNAYKQNITGIFR